MHELRREQLIRAPFDEVCAFFRRPENLEHLTPSWLGFRILTPSPVPMHEGALIDYVIQLGPIPLRWRSMITSDNPPGRFVDQQLSGPYSFWHHTHDLVAVPAGTLVRDHVRYLLPGGWLGVVVHRLVVKRLLGRIFRFRASAVAAIFPSD